MSQAHCRFVYGHRLKVVVIVVFDDSILAFNIFFLFVQFWKRTHTHRYTKWCIKYLNNNSWFSYYSLLFLK